MIQILQRNTMFFAEWRRQRVDYHELSGTKLFWMSQGVWHENKGSREEYLGAWTEYHNAMHRLLWMLRDKDWQISSECLSQKGNLNILKSADNTMVHVGLKRPRKFSSFLNVTLPETNIAWNILHSAWWAEWFKRRGNVMVHVLGLENQGWIFHLSIWKSLPSLQYSLACVYGSVHNPKNLLFWKIPNLLRRKK